MPANVDGYRLEQLLGRGGQGEVWSARARRGGEPVAIKLVPTGTDRALTSARREAALLTVLAHPNLIALIEVVECDGFLALVMERADGGSLSWLLRRRYRLSGSEVVAALTPVAAALAYAHGQAVAHCDVSAGNILFTASGHPKLADLGVARLAAGDRPSTDLIATPAYCDPVVVAGAAPGPASDVFALAAVGLRALTGLGPWQRSRGDSVADVLAAAARGEVPELPARLAGAPAELAAVLTQALDADPGRRPTATEFALDLGACAPADRGEHRGRVVLNAGQPAAGDPPAGRHAAPVARRAVEERGADQPGRLDHISIELTRLRPSRPREPQPVASRRRSRGVLIGCGVFGALAIVASAGYLSRATGATQVSPPPPPPPTTSAAGPAAETAAQALSRLDAARAAAFAQRDPALLKRVYSSPELLEEDTRQLLARVPIGCALTAFRTSYRPLAMRSAAADTLDVTAQATGSPAVLRCGSGAARAVRAPAPATLRISLRAVDGAYRIEAIADLAQ